MCLRELFREFVVAQRRAREAQERDLSHAWHTAALALSGFGGKFPTLEQFLQPLKQAAKPVTRREQAEQHRSALAILAERYGVPLRTRTRPKKATA